MGFRLVVFVKHVCGRGVGVRRSPTVCHLQTVAYRGVNSVKGVDRHTQEWGWIQSCATHRVGLRTPRPITAVCVHLLQQALAAAAVRDLGAPTSLQSGGVPTTGSIHLSRVLGLFAPSAVALAL
jgi:hypothetical protein